jgi:hypothetical protein
MSWIDLPRILFEVNAFDAHQPRGGCALIIGTQFHQHFALAHDGRVELGNLVALRQVGIEVILAVKGRGQMDLGLQPKPGAHRLRHAGLVDDGQHAGHAGVDKGHIGIGFGTEPGRGAGEQFRPGGDLGVHLHADHKFPVVFRACDDLGFGAVIAEVEHRGLRSRRRVV